MSVELPAVEPDLFGRLPDEYWPAVPEGARKVTGDLARKQVITYRAVVALSGHMTQREIASTLGISHHTVGLIQSRHAADVATHKERFGSECLRTAAKLRQRVEDQVDVMEGKDAAIAMGILTEKGLLLMGEATAIVEQRGDGDRAAYEAWMRSVRDITPRTPDSESGASISQDVENQRRSPMVATLDAATQAIPGAPELEALVNSALKVNAPGATEPAATPEPAALEALDAAAGDGGGGVLRGAAEPTGRSIAP